MMSNWFSGAAIYWLAYMHMVIYTQIAYFQKLHIFIVFMWSLFMSFISFSPEESEQQFQEIWGHTSDHYGSTQVASLEDAQPPRSTLANHCARVTQPTSSTLKPPVLPSPTNHTWDVYVTHVSAEFVIGLYVNVIKQNSFS